MYKKLLFLLIFNFVSLTFINAQGFITHVNAHNQTHLNWYGDFYKRVKFPEESKEFKKIMMKFTIGCPSIGCSDWDYTVKVFARRQIGVDTANKLVYEYIEFARYITPYAGDKNAGYFRDFEVDVTDFRSVLKDSVDIGIKFEGYQDGFTASVDFYLTAGRAVRKAVKVVPVYYGGFPYGDPNNSIENYLKPFQFQLDSSNQEVGIHILQTGHGFGGNEDCAEFCPKYNYVKVNGVLVGSNLVWKDDCGKNAIFPQPGTWIYDRANWCPGEMVNAYYHDLTPYIKADSANTFDLDMTPFTNINNNNCSYNVAANLIYYTDRIADVDLEMVEILAPSKKWNHARFNPICGRPIVKVRNNSRVPVNGLKLGSHIYPGTNNNYLRWQGTILPYETKEIELNYIEFKDTLEFEVSVWPLDSTIQEYDDTNNHIITKYDLVKILPPRFAIEFRTNAAPQENSYFILDELGNVVHQKNNFTAVNTMHRDTISLAKGCYTFLFQDSDKDGLTFFANSDGSGSLRFRNMAGTYFQVFNPNFGTEVRYNFSINPAIVGVEKTLKPTNIELYPNPAKDEVHIEHLDGARIKSVKIFNNLGQMVQIHDEMTLSGSIDLKLNKLTSGVYIFEIETDKGVYREKLEILN